ncbi:MAG: aldo/keto reductase [Micromonosporaceae bacterium]|nr:aldo/keto reductase [Micromonosporaceae bacterium]
MRRKRLGHSLVTVTALGFGASSIGNLSRAVSDEDAARVVEAAWTAGIRYFDTAPHYGLGLAERRLGMLLSGVPRDEFTLSTKVGRVLVDDPSGDGKQDPEGFHVPATARRVWDLSAAGVRRSLDDSLRRLGFDRIDIALIHDPEEGGLAAALDQAYPALHELREQRVIGAIGVGSKRWQVLERFVSETAIDAVMLAGRYTLLEQPALDDLLPACVDRGVSVLNAGVFNSGLLSTASPHTDRRYEYGEAPEGKVLRAERIAEICRQHGTSLPAAALTFAGAHPAVATVVLGTARAEHLRMNAELASVPPPPEFWKELVAEGLLHPSAPVPRAIRMVRQTAAPIASATRRNTRFPRASR